MGPVPLLLLCCALVLCYFYPLTRAAHEEIMLRLVEQRQRLRDTASGKREVELRAEERPSNESSP
jgi:Na+/melibiose symporter-like transporter